MQVGEQQFSERGRRIIADHVNAENKANGSPIRITPDDVYMPWFCKTLQNAKGTFSTNRADGIYYELTYDGDRERFYLDVYQKTGNFVIPLCATV